MKNCIFPPAHCFWAPSTLSDIPSNSHCCIPVRKYFTSGTAGCCYTSTSHILPGAVYLGSVLLYQVPGELVQGTSISYCVHGYMLKFYHAVPRHCRFLQAVPHQEQTTPHWDVLENRNALRRTSRAGLERKTGGTTDEADAQEREMPSASARRKPWLIQHSSVNTTRTPTVGLAALTGLPVQSPAQGGGAPWPRHDPRARSTFASP